MERGCRLRPRRARAAAGRGPWPRRRGARRAGVQVGEVRVAGGQSSWEAGQVACIEARCGSRRVAQRGGSRRRAGDPRAAAPIFGHGARQGSSGGLPRRRSRTAQEPSHTTYARNFSAWPTRARPGPPEMREEGCLTSSPPDAAGLVGTGAVVEVSPGFPRGCGGGGRVGVPGTRHQLEGGPSQRARSAPCARRGSGWRSAAHHRRDRIAAAETRALPGRASALLLAAKARRAARAPARIRRRCAPQRRGGRRISSGNCTVPSAPDRGPPRDGQGRVKRA